MSPKFEHPNLQESGKKESKCQKQDFWGPLLGFWNLDVRWWVFFPSKAPIFRPAMTCNLLRLFMPTRSWEYLSDWPQGCLVLPKFCAVFFVKDRGRMFFNHCSFAVTKNDCTILSERCFWKGFTNLSVQISISMMKLHMSHPFEVRPQLQKKKHQQILMPLMALYFHDENCLFPPTPADGVPKFSVEGLEVAFKTPWWRNFTRFFP